MTEEHDETYEMYFEIMKENPPLKRYVSRGDIPDEIDVPGPHQEADRVVLRAIRNTHSDKTSRLQPILGSAGMGKTHFFWVLKDREEDADFSAVYVPSPPSPIRNILHIYSCLVDETANWIFKEVGEKLEAKYGIKKKGIFIKRYEVNDALNKVIEDYPGLASDVVRSILAYNFGDDEVRSLARRWLLGAALSDEEMKYLGVMTLIEEDDISLAALKVLTEMVDRPIVLFIDEMEGPFNTYGKEAEIRFLENLKRIYNETQNVVIVASCLKEIWDRIFGLMDAPTRSRMERPVELEKFKKEHIIEFYKKAMDIYWEENNIDGPEDELFPLKDTDFDYIIEHSKGNPREAIRLLIDKLDEKLFGKKIEEKEPQKDYVIKLTPTVVAHAITKALEWAARGVGVDVSLLLSPEDKKSKQDVAAIISVKQNEREVKVAVEVPNVKNWDRSGGVAAFYGTKRLKKVIEEGKASRGIIVVPKKTTGAKFEQILQEMEGRVIPVKVNQEEATRLAESSMSNMPDENTLSMVNEILKALVQ